MTLRPGELKPRLTAGEQLLGGILRMPGESLVETMGMVGLDFVVLDCEHGPSDDIGLLRHITAADAVGLGVLVRVGALRSDEIQRALDLGAAGIVVPHVRDAEHAADAVAAAHYPPIGRRGLAVYTRAGRHGLADTREHMAAASDRTLVVAMIEDGDGVGAAGRIASVAGVDALFVGPGDLSASLGHPGDPVHPDVVRATAAVHEEARGAGRAVMSIVSSSAAADSALQAGCSLVVYNVQAMVTDLLHQASTVRDHRLAPTTADQVSR